MKRIFAMTLAALALLAAGCDKSAPDVTPAAGGDLVGKWYIQLKDAITGIGYLSDGTAQRYNRETQQWVSAGTWSYENGLLTYKTTDHEEKYDASLYNNNTVLTLKYAEEESGEVIGFYYKDGKISGSDASALQGTWDWFSFGKEAGPRIRFVFSGNAFDLIIPVWGDRYTGTFTYKDGYVTLFVDQCWTSRIPHGNADEETITYDQESGQINASWSTTVQDWEGVPHPYAGPLVGDGTDIPCAFAVAGSNLAFSNIFGMGLIAELTKTN